MNRLSLQGTYKTALSGKPREAVNVSYKLQQAVSRVLSRMVIYLGQTSPPASSRRIQRCRADLTSVSGVAPNGVYSVPVSPRERVSSYLAFSPLLLSQRLFSVTLLHSREWLPVRKYGALCCPDFPLASYERQTVLLYVTKIR